MTDQVADNERILMNYNNYIKLDTINLFKLHDLKFIKVNFTYL